MAKTKGGRVTPKRGPERRRTRLWVPAVAVVVAAAFIGVLLATAPSQSGPSGPTTKTPATTLIVPPTIVPKGSTLPTLGGSSARCRDGTYSYRGGSDTVPDADLCAGHGGVEQRLGR